MEDTVTSSLTSRRNDSVYPLGCMHLNKLRDIKRVGAAHPKFKITKFKFSRVGEDDASSDDEEHRDSDKLAPIEEEK